MLLKDGRIVGAMLVGPDWSGVFVRWEGETKGLLMLRGPDGHFGNGFGHKQDQ